MIKKNIAHNNATSVCLIMKPVLLINADKKDIFDPCRMTKGCVNFHCSQGIWFKINVKILYVENRIISFCLDIYKLSSDCFRIRLIENKNDALC